MSGVHVYQRSTVGTWLAGTLATLAAVLSRAALAVASRLDETMLPGSRLEQSVLRRTAELATSEAAYRAFFEHAEDSLCDVDVSVDGGFLCRTINPHAEAVMGLRAADIAGLGPEQVLGPVAGARLALALRRCIEQGGLRYEESWNTRGGVRITDTIMVPLRGAPGTGDEDRIVRVLCSMRDITERRDLETRLAQAQKMQALGQLAGGIAHDFNNVLQAIQGSTALIERRASDSEAVIRLARIVLAAADRGSSITRRLLAFARRDELRAEPVEIAPLLTDLREVFARTLGAAIAVCTELAPGLPAVLADKGQLETVLVNLATNARDAMPRGGTLTLAARADTILETLAGGHPVGLKPGTYVRVDVADTGSGMDAATLARATEPFFTTKPTGSGTGLGLSMARGFAEQSGGALTIVSEPELGTTVTFWLPQAVRAAPAAEAEPLPIAGLAGQAKLRPRLLVVDDDALVRETLGMLLDEAGYAVRCAEDAGAALLHLDAGEAFDLLLSDLSMPGMDGMTLIREAQRRRPTLPAILLTGYAEDGVTAVINRGDGTASGAGVPPGRFALLRKPVSTAALLERMATLLVQAAE